jgi:hypothetical protein
VFKKHLTWVVFEIVDMSQRAECRENCDEPWLQVQELSSLVRPHTIAVVEISFAMNYVIIVASDLLW